MIALLQVPPPSTLEQYGFMGVMCTILLSAVAYLGKRMLDIVREVSTTNAQSAIAITQSVAVLDKLEARVGEMEHGLETGVVSSMAAHEKTHTLLEEAIGELREKPPRRTGRAHLGALFTLALGTGAATMAEMSAHEERRVEPHATWTHAFDLLAQAQPGIIR